MNTGETNKKKRRAWTETETEILLTIMRDKKIVQLLDGKRYRNRHIFQIVSEELKKSNFIKTSDQIRIKWKHLKTIYFKIKRKNNTSGESRNECPHWDLLQELLSNRPIAAASRSFGAETQDFMGEASNGMRFESSQDEETDSELNPNENSNDTPVFTDTSLMSRNEATTLTNPVASTSSMSRNEATTSTASVASTSSISDKKRKITKAYATSMKALVEDWKGLQENMQQTYFEQQQKIIQEEMQKQREWEEKFLREEREATERLYTSMINTFFQNMTPLLQNNSRLSNNDQNSENDKKDTNLI